MVGDACPPHPDLPLQMHQKYTEYSHCIQATLKEFFPSWTAVTRHKEVIIFTVGLLKDPTPLIDYVYDMYIEKNLETVRSVDHFVRIDRSLFYSLYHESVVPFPDHPLHNGRLNYYNHAEDDGDLRTRDVTPVFVPSKLYVFTDMREYVLCNITHEKQGEKVPECAMRIDMPRHAVAETLLSTCMIIWGHQLVTDLFMEGVFDAGHWAAEQPITIRKTDVFQHYKGTTLSTKRAREPTISTKACSLILIKCGLPLDFMINIFHQLSGCLTLQRLQLLGMNLGRVEDSLDGLLERLVSNHHETGADQRQLELRLQGGNELVNLSEKFKNKWKNRCERISSVNLEIQEYSSIPPKSSMLARCNSR